MLALSPAFFAGLRDLCAIGAAARGPDGRGQLLEAPAVITSTSALVLPRLRCADLPLLQARLAPRPHRSRKCPGRIGEVEDPENLR